MGLALAMCQQVESRLGWFVALALHDDPLGQKSEEGWVTTEKNLAFISSKKTLGQLAHRMKQSGIDLGGFSDEVTEFVGLRNRFAHGLFVEDGYTINGAENMPRIRSYLDKMFEIGTRLMFVMDMHMEAWCEYNNVPPEDEPPEIYKSSIYKSYFKAFEDAGKPINLG